MQRWCWRLRSLAAALHSSPKPHPHTHPLTSNRVLHTFSNLLNKPQTFNAIPVIYPNFKPFLNASPTPHLAQSPLTLTQVRHLTLKQRKRKLKSRQPMTPVVSKVKKIKMKCYSSYKDRFRTMHDGQIRRWKEGKRHNAHLKSKKSKRRLRKPGVVPPAYAKVMKKLNFCG